MVGRVTSNCIWLCCLILASPVPALGADGAGSARLVAPERLVAGERCTVVLEFTVGPGGIPVGGGVSMGLHHAASWQAVQITADGKPGFATVRGFVPDNLEVSWHDWAPKGTFSDGPTGKSDSIHHQVLMAKVRNRALEAGEKLTFTLGANEHGIQVQKQVDRDHEFHFATDTDGDGTYKRIAEQPMTHILPAAPHHLYASVPAMVQAGAPFKILVRAEDEFYNLATGYRGAVTIRGESGEVLAEGVALEDGLARVPITIPGPGPQRFRLSDGSLEGRSNPCRVFETLPKYRIFWGDIHGHTSISDGLGNTASEYYTFARDVAGLDVCALTDHGHFDWPQTVETVKAFYRPGKFVTLLAQEAGAGADHMNLYFREDDAPHINGWATEYGPFYEMVFRQYNKDEPTALTGPHHFTYNRGDDRYPFGLWDERTARFAEVYSSHGTSEYLDNPRPCQGAKDPRKFLQHGLSQGRHFGVIASSDNHDSHPGRSVWGHYPGGHVAFLAPKLTREAIWDALWNYRVYAASFDRIYIEFAINAQSMGRQVVTSGSCHVSYYVVGRDGDIKVFLIRNNEEHRVDRSADGVVEVSFEEIPPPGETFYYLRVVQKNGERAWSTPIWVTR